MLPVLFDLLWRRDQNPLLPPTFPTPALRKVREGRGTRCVGDGRWIKSLGHPPGGNPGDRTDPNF